MKQNIVLFSSLIVLLLLVGSASAGLNEDVSVDSCKQVIEEDTPVSNDPAVWTPLVHFTLNNSAEIDYYLDELEFRVLREGSPLEYGDIEEIGIFAADDFELGYDPAATVGYKGIYFDDAGTAIFNINSPIPNATEGGTAEFILAMRVSETWSDNDDCNDYGLDSNDDAVRIEVVRYILDDASYILESGTAGEYVWYADTTNPTVELSYNATGSFKAGDVVNITATFDEPVDYADIYIEGPSDNGVMSSASELGDVWYYEYAVSYIFSGYVNVSIDSADFAGNFVEENNDVDAFLIDNTIPTCERVAPAKFVDTNSVLFNFSASDYWDDELEYTLYIEGDVNQTGTVDSGDYEEFVVELPDGNYSCEIELEDDAGNIGSTGVFALYVDTGAPTVTLIAPDDFYVNTTGYLSFNFTAEDALTAEYDEYLDLYYELFIDGVLNKTASMNSGDYIPHEDIGPFSDGAHNWSVYVEDDAGNNFTSEVREFYVITEDLGVNLVSPNSGFVSSNAVFHFTVDGGEGLPFDYRLLINGEEVANGSFVVGESEYNVTVQVTDGEDMNWTVNVTDCAGNTYEPEPYSFSIDTIDPSPVTGITVSDALDPEIYDYYYYQVYVDEGGDLDVSWDISTDSDFGYYAVFVSTSPCADISEMDPYVYDDGYYYFEYVFEDNETNSTSIMGLENGETYYVAVVVFDRAGNYNESYEWVKSVPYEDTNIALEEGWNLVSVPAYLLDSSKSASFGTMPVLYWNGTGWEASPDIEPAKAYWVYSEEETEVCLKYKPMGATNPDVPPAVSLEPGWQMIGVTTKGGDELLEYKNQMISLGGELNDDADYIYESGFEPRYSNLLTYTPSEGWGSVLDYEMGYYDYDEDNYGPVASLAYDGYVMPGQGYWVFVTRSAIYSGAVASVEDGYTFDWHIADTIPYSYGDVSEYCDIVPPYGPIVDIVR